MAKQILFDDKARIALKRGIDKLAAAVRMTLGPRGRAVVIEKGYGAPQVTFDGVTVAKEIEFEDKHENLGAEFIKQAADKTNDSVGDGTSTSIVLAQTMIESGMRAVNEAGLDVIKLADELNNISKSVIHTLEKQKEAINDPKKVEEVATLSSKDKQLGKLIAQVMNKIGKDGVVTVDDSNTIENSFEIVEGMNFDRGYISQYMITNAEKMESVYENADILITDKKISSIQEILPFLEKIAQKGKKELVIIAEEVDGDALTTLVVNKIRGTFSALAIKAPGYGDRREEMLEDIAIITGGKVISEKAGLKLDKADLSVLGKASKVISNKDNTTIVGGAGDKGDIEKRVKQLRAQIDKSTSDYDKEKLQERVAKLSGGVAVLKIGAPTESAQKELKQRVDDAVAATKAAMEEGIVPGGGIALFNVCQIIMNDVKPYEILEVKAAMGIISEALMAPLKAIIANSGETPSRIIELLDKEKKAKGDNWLGFNAITRKVEDLKSAGIIDPLKVTKSALLNAVSVAANFLMVGAAITEIPKKDPLMPGPMPGGMPEGY
ncbi:chaperonin GroL [Candidatus Giovannonibacteria bacterium RIFCSPLOWO2_02_FULL_45_14]|uniref:60 kDa chaperonin n=1 Tax=Candidatus Giovannonibacteria bacterium RIFCSPLOWO2_12_FULL_44_15 TaxID=1798364 RepID=A0A1F5XZX6_9BACT|nr:MAG: chaperonin GroL [Candidatus Giovannonibacteria bacterium RIFCSPHIGHO2_02_FULL_44_31]OGF75943.1 MAG: chaperonin GroL [Candidatus Giovannonibacteria bacterium RIFCSPHIGHO2_12_FULL_44_29]OGF90662.1 MAG: chaperonin GroL [Candidatus Giovannonibacteria bacterium RIFCSPLOWO2_02_FULL_45_14]OGF93402.1 MAG: chaperonin GroL [Candidatus Giovannonibacteria bacterium RIFCSPLOWO2_12_FULL_44_15]